ncbi:MAG: DMT family transporter [Aestuariivita sp.]|nr:DMT family transporter [Aestuariivita sp.]
MDTRSLLMGLIFSLMWSSAFTSARVIVVDASPLYALSLRFFISGLLGIVIALLIGQTWKLTKSQWYATIIFGLCQNGLYLGLNFIAMQTVEAGLAAIIASLLPLLVAVVSWLCFREHLGVLGIFGLIFGFFGVSIIMSTRISIGVDLYGVSLCVVGVLALTFATLSLRSATSSGNFLMIVGLQMLIGSGALFFAAVVLETPYVNPSWPLFIAFAYTTLVPGLAATLIWFMLVDRIGAVRAATFHFLNPFFGVTIAAMLIGESLSIGDIIGVIIVTLGILAVQIARQSTRTPM